MLIDGERVKKNLRKLLSNKRDTATNIASDSAIWASIKMVEAEEERTRIKAHKS